MKIILLVGSSTQLRKQIPEDRAKVQSYFGQGQNHLNKCTALTKGAVGRKIIYIRNYLQLYLKKNLPNYFTVTYVIFKLLKSLR